MFKSFCKSLFLFLVVVQFSGCFGYAVQTSSIPTKKYRYAKRVGPVNGWEKLQVYEEEMPEQNYEVVARIVVTGGGNTTESKMMKKLRMEAGYYGADAIIFVEIREVSRSTLNGFALAANILTAFNDDGCDDTYIEAGGEYDALELEGEAIRFVDDY